jgi:MFS family permease
MLRLGMALFGLASLFCALSTSGLQLGAARVIQGAGAALMVPQVLGLIGDLYPPAERQTPMMWFGIAFGLGAVVGQVGGAGLVTVLPLALGWRAVFLVALPIVALVSVGLRAPSSRALQERSPAGVDWPGSLGLAAGLLPIFVGLTLLTRLGVALRPVGVTVAGTAICALVIRYEFVVPRRRPERSARLLVHPKLVKSRAFRLGLLAVASYFVAFGGLLFALTFALQAGLDFTPVQAGMVFLPQGVGFIVGAWLGGRLPPRAAVWRIPAGGILAAGSCAVMLPIVSSSTSGLAVEVLAPVTFMLGFANGVAIPALIGEVVSRVPTSVGGTAAGLMSATQQVGMGFGVTAFGLLVKGAGNAGGQSALLRALEHELVAASVLIVLGVGGYCLMTRR